MGAKTVDPVGQRLTGVVSDITAMKLAELVVNDTGEHDWLADKLGLSGKTHTIAKFTNSDHC